MAYTPIDIGTAGDPQTGETIFSGGEKLNAMLKEIYEANAPASSDYRMTGHWIKDESDLVDILDPLPPGIKVDVNTQIAQKTLSVGGTQVYDVGDEIQLRDQFNTWGSNPVVIQTSGGGFINGRTQQQIRSSGAIITLTCVDSENNNWDMQVTSKRGRFDNIVDVRGSITPLSSLNTVVYNSQNIAAAKLLIVATDDSDVSRKTVSEMLVTDDGTSTSSTEYALINTSTSSLIDISFEYVANEVVLIASTTESSITIRIKTIEFTDL